VDLTILVSYPYAGGNRVSSGVCFLRTILHRADPIFLEWKVCPILPDDFIKFQGRKFFFLTMSLYLCNRLFELCKALYIIVEDRSLNHYLLHFITH